MEAGEPEVGGLVSPDGQEELALPLPAKEKKHNVGGRDGAGLCVFTSIEYASRWCHEPALFELQASMRKELGGGYPSKVDTMLKKYAPGVQYLQSTQGDLELLRAAIKGGRMPAVTYNGHDPHYRGSISHMVTLVHLSDKWAAISDNNYPGDDQVVWMSPQAFLQRHNGGGGGWCVILLRYGPPPPPHN